MKIQLSDHFTYGRLLRFDMADKRNLVCSCCCGDIGCVRIGWHLVSLKKKYGY